MTNAEIIAALADLGPKFIAWATGTSTETIAMPGGDRIPTLRSGMASLAAAGPHASYATPDKAVAYGIKQIVSLIGGNGGTNGTFALGISGGSETAQAVGHFVVAGGTVIGVYIDDPGFYTGATAPTLSFAASSGLTGASATAVMAKNVAEGGVFSVPGTDANTAWSIFKVVSGAAVLVTTVPNASALAVAAADAAIATAARDTTLTYRNEAAGYAQTVITDASAAAAAMDTAIAAAAATGPYAVYRTYAAMAADSEIPNDKAVDVLEDETHGGRAWQYWKTGDVVSALRPLPGSEYLMPENLNAVGNGITDDRDKINSIEAIAKLTGLPVRYTQTYAVKRQVVFKTGVVRYGVPNKDTFIIAPDFVSADYIVGAESVAFVNDGFSYSYNEATAFSGSFVDITIRNDSTTGYGPGAGACIRFGNINGVNIANLKVYTNTTAQVGDLLDFVACCRNVVVVNPVLINLTPATNAAGGCCWVRNRCVVPTSAAEAEANKTCNIVFIGGRMISNSIDEALAIWDSLGGIDTISVFGGEYSSAAMHLPVVSVFTQNANPYVYVTNVLMEGLLISKPAGGNGVTDAVVNFNSGNGANRFNATLRNAKIIVGSGTTDYGIGVCNYGTAPGVVCENVLVDVTGSSHAIHSAFSGPMTIVGGGWVGDNLVTVGAYNCTKLVRVVGATTVGYSAEFCGLVDDCTLASGLSAGACVRRSSIRGGRYTAAHGRGALNDDNAYHSVKDADITITQSGADAITIAGGSYGDYAGNRLHTTGAARPFTITAAGYGSINIINNTSDGTDGVAGIYGANYATRVNGNNWYGSFNPIGTTRTTTVAQANAVTLTNATPAAVGTNTPPAGEWVARGIIYLDLSGAVIAANSPIYAGIKVGGATLTAQQYDMELLAAGTLTGAPFIAVQTPEVPITATPDATAPVVNLVAQASFTGGTVKAWGQLSLRKTKELA